MAQVFFLYYFFKKKDRAFAGLLLSFVKNILIFLFSTTDEGIYFIRNKIVGVEVEIF